MKVSSTIGRKNNSLQDSVKDSLSFEWNLVVAFFRNMVTRVPKNTDSVLIYKFGNERVTVRSQMYRNYRLPYLIELSIFGNDLSLMKEHEVIMETKKQVLLHVSLQQRMKEIFSQEALNATEFLV